MTSKRIIPWVLTIFAAAMSASGVHGAAPQIEQVLFVCEHGNVKSLMATSYFNEVAQSRGLPWRAVSRGVAPDSNSVPAPIVAALRDEGFDVGAFRPAALTPADVAASTRVITIGSTLPREAASEASSVERWNDVPAATTNYAEASESLRDHVEALIDTLMRNH